MQSTSKGTAAFGSGWSRMSTLPDLIAPINPWVLLQAMWTTSTVLGNRSDDRWIKVCKAIDQMYKWGSVKCNAYRHAGTDLEILQDPKLGRCLVIDQKYYIETLQDVEVTPSRFSDSDSQLTTQEISACRASLGALQLLAIQTQPLICARCNILLTELSTNPKMTIAQEIQEMVKELRKMSSVLKFSRFQM